jgi:hypothetical protein
MTTTHRLKLVGADKLEFDAGVVLRRPGQVM